MYNFKPGPLWFYIVFKVFSSTSRYLDDLLNIDNPYFEHMVGQIYPTKLQVNKANSADTEAPFLDLDLSIANGIVSSKIYDKRDDFRFEIVNFPFLVLEFGTNSSQRVKNWYQYVTYSIPKFHIL